MHIASLLLLFCLFFLQRILLVCFDFDILFLFRFSSSISNFLFDFIFTCYPLIALAWFLCIHYTRYSVYTHFYFVNTFRSAFAFYIKLKSMCSLLLFFCVCVCVFRLNCFCCFSNIFTLLILQLSMSMVYHLPHLVRQ